MDCLSLRILKFPTSLSVEDTRKSISIAFTKWSDVSPLTFTEVTNGNATVDITIGRWSYTQHRLEREVVYLCVCVCARFLHL